MPKALEAQRDFSAGEIDVSAKRSDQSAEVAPLLKAGLRQASNMRIRNSKAIRNRPGRTALFLESGRVEKILMSPGNYFYIAFGAGTLRVYNTAGAQLFTQSGFSWALATVANVRWAIFGTSIYIAFAGQIPKVLTWDGAVGWSVANFAEATGVGQQKRTLFYRISPKGITLLLSGAGTVGTSCNAVFSSPILVAGHVGTRIRYVGRQLLITAVVNSFTATVTVEETISPTNILSLISDPRTIISVGDVVIGNSSGGKGIVTAVGATSIHVQPLSTAVVVSAAPSSASSEQDRGAGVVPAITTATAFLGTETIVGPAGSVVASSVALSAQEAVRVWDEELMNAYRGYPSSVFVDQNRLGFCGFPGLPNAIAWTAIGTPNDLYVEAQPQSAILEIAPEKVQIYDVLAGPESSEFVFCDRKIYYIPISTTNPLKPGSVAFNVLSSSGAMPVQPRLVDEDIIYVAGPNTINSIVAPGQYYRPYGTRNLTEVSTHLINNPVALAIPTQAGTFAEQYIYVLNADGTIAVGKYETENGQIKGVVGWTPWSGAGTASFVSAVDAQITFTSVYPGANVVEALDDTVYLDAAMLVNAAPAAFAPPGGKGPLWWIAGRTVELMDQGSRSMGTYQVDANGFIVPQNIGGEDLTLASLLAGQTWTSIIEPIIPAAPPGPDAHQRMNRRRIPRIAAHVADSTGFAFIKIASRIGTQLPAVGTTTVIRRFPAWSIDDNPTLPPPQRETTHRTRPNGRDFDPRVGLMKDTPGPWEVLEIGVEAGT